MARGRLRLCLWFRNGMELTRIAGVLLSGLNWKFDIWICESFHLILELTLWRTAFDVYFVNCCHIQFITIIDSFAYSIWCLFYGLLLSSCLCGFINKNKCYGLRYKNILLPPFSQTTSARSMSILFSYLALHCFTNHFSYLFIKIWINVIFII